MHHRRVVQERRKLLTDFERLKRHYEQYEPTLAELRHKYEVVMKEKMLMRLERDRWLGKAENLGEQLDQAQKTAANAADMGSPFDAEGQENTTIKILKMSLIELLFIYYRIFVY